ncbi:hypothetical protein Dimus_030459 [Dionaea muscipula]
MGARTRGWSQQRPREVECDERSPDWRSVLFWGSPSPRPPRVRRGPPSSGTRPRHHRSPSPLIAPSPDPDEVSSSEEEDASEAAVTTSEAAIVAVEQNLVSSLSSDKVSHSLALSSMEGGDSAVSGVPLLGGGEVDPGCAAIGGLVSSMGAGSGSSLKRAADCGELLEADSGSSQIPIVGVDVQCSSIFPSNCVVVDFSHGLCGGGMVSEEARVLPVAREALRLQPTDGLWQLSSAPVDPVSVVESRGGQDGYSGGRSYAHVVQVDRRADVELSYIPPVDGILSLWRSLMGTNNSGDLALWDTSFRGPWLLDLLDPLLLTYGVN